MGKQAKSKQEPEQEKLGGFGQGLEPKQVLAAVALASGDTRAEVALCVGVAESTIYRWLEKPTFKQAIRDSLSEEVRRLRREAYRTLGGAMRGEDADRAVRAADLLLKHTASEGDADTATTNLNVRVDKVDDATLAQIDQLLEQRGSGEE